MILSKLLENIDVINSKVDLSENIEYIFSDSRKSKGNGAFIAIKGEQRDGNDYVRQILNANEKCVITDQISVYESNDQTILVKDARRALSHAWNNFLEKPTSDMRIIAITGTNGKTSCANYIYNILKAGNKKRGLISTIECLINDEIININGGSDVVDLHSAMTTPDPEILFSIFKKMQQEQVEYVVMEASSHALELFKIDPINVNVAIFTNLSEEHLDFHKNMDNYFMAKSKLFNNCDIGIVNLDDEYGKKILNKNKEGFFGYSIKKKSDFYASDIEFLNFGIKYILNFKNRNLEIKSKSFGEFSVYNTMASVACAIELGIDEKAIQIGIENTEKIKGRFEKIGENIFIDYAHTPSAMESILYALKKSMPEKKIIALFGCGGDRDKGKREKMGKIASDFADTVIITSDNSRNEPLTEIIRDILKGFEEKNNYLVIPKREDAINFALKIKKENNALILLGKGHEDYEIDKTGKHYFSEKKIIEKALKNDKY